jgi:hypothetical protein
MCMMSGYTVEYHPGQPYQQYHPGEYKICDILVSILAAELNKAKTKLDGRHSILEGRAICRMDRRRDVMYQDQHST